jgi:two-component system response regulator YesN
MGINFLEYVNQLKMEKAKDILQAGKIKVREVANEVGILDEAYFSKLFKKYTSMSPKEFKALNRLRG